MKAFTATLPLLLLALGSGSGSATATAPSGSDDQASRSRDGGRRSREGGGKGKLTLEGLSRCGKGKGMGKGKGKGMGKGKGASVETMTPKAKCAVFSAYVEAEHAYGRPPTRAPTPSESPTFTPPGRFLLGFSDGGAGRLCGAFAAVNPHVCPQPDAVDSICSEARPEKNPAVVAGYCDPLFEGVCFEDEAERDECVRRCVQYVSRANGDCCGLGCD